MRLSGRVAVITGAASGIGAAIARALSKQQYDLVLVGRNVEGLSAAAGDIKSQTPECQVLCQQADLTNAEDREAILNCVVAEGYAEILLVNNAGIGKMGHLEQLSAADIEKVLATNLLGHILVTKYCLPVMKQHHAYSDLIFIGSESARQGGKEGSVYCASKFGLRGFAQSLRPECAKAGVRVNLINPGAVRSAFFDELHFEPGPEAEHAILPADVAAIVLAVVNSRAGTVLDEINMSPLTKVWQSKLQKG